MRSLRRYRRQYKRYVPEVLPILALLHRPIECGYFFVTAATMTNTLGLS
jgi:hypothetical protein